MDLDTAREQLQTLHRAVICTRRSDGSPQMSPVVCALDQDGRVIVSSRETAMKVKHLRRDPSVALCVFTEEFFGTWLQIEGEAEIVSLPDAMEKLIEYYRTVSGEHPDWDEYRRAMERERRVLITISLRRAGPDVSG